MFISKNTLSYNGDNMLNNNDWKKDFENIKNEYSEVIQTQQSMSEIDNKIKNNKNNLSKIEDQKAFDKLKELKKNGRIKL
jgi:predicted  nucleic acid-binding Zn-ribbon protein